MKQPNPSQPNRLTRWGGYYLIPHELLHVAAYRIIGKPCHYQWGDWRVQSLKPKSRGENIFVLLFPVLVCWGIGGLLYLFWLGLMIVSPLSPQQYLFIGSRWQFLLPITALGVILYGGHTSGKDFLKVYWWLFLYKTEDKGQQPHQTTDEKEGDGHRP